MVQKTDLYIFIFLHLLLIILDKTAIASERKPLPLHRAFADYTSVPPQIDGKVDKVWLNIKPQDGFIQHSPEDGLPTTNETKFYVLYDEKNIYFLFIMLDKEKNSIPARLVDRDYDIYPDDNINFYIDTYNDNRKAFYFSANPRGVEQDGLISENGDKVDMTWDGIYDCESKINKYGWIAEFAIPFKTLRFTDELKYQIWGFNVWRVRKKSREISFWSPVDQNFRIYRLDKGGVLIGMKNIQSGQHINLFPYITAKQLHNGRTKNDFEHGIDFKYNPTSDLTLDLTINPDFGQVEIDEEQIILDKRYEIQLEEKRPFFLENTTLFQSPFYQLFYSRRIGAQNEINGGAKFSGKIGTFNIGALSALTGLKQDNQANNVTIRDDRELYNVFRIQGDILNSSNIGFMYVNREKNITREGYQFNRAASVDWSIYHGQNYFRGQSVYSTNSLDRTNGGALFGQFGHYGRLIWIDLSAHYYEPDFDIDSTGFFQKIPGKGKRQVSLYSEIHPLINSKYLRSWGFSLAPTIIRDSDEIETAWGIKGTGWVEAPDQSRLKIGYTRYRDVELDLFYSYFNRQYGGELVYWGRDLFAEIETDPGKNISLFLKWNRDFQYYFQTHTTGFNQGVESAVRVKPYSNVYFELSYKRRWFMDEKMKQMLFTRVGQTAVRIWTLRGRYLLTKDLFSRIFFQYTNAAEDFSRDPLDQQIIFPLQYTTWDRISLNTLVGWRFKPGSTLYLVYTQQWENLWTNNLASTKRVLFFKFSYFWNL